MARRYYSSTAVETTLSGSISNSATSITATALSGFPNTTPWTAIIDADTASEELVEVTNVAGTTLTVTRGVDGTAAVSHNAGASFRHGVSARDFDEANDHVNDSTGVHGLGASSSVVGTTDTQTLTNKTIDIASNTLTGVAPVANPTFTGVASFPDGSASAPSITNTGDTNTGLAFPADDTVIVSTAGTERVRVSSGGLVGIGTTAPAQQLHVSRDTGLNVLFRTSAANVGILIDRSNTTIAAPSVVSAGDTIGNLSFRGYDGGAFRTAAQIVCVVDGAPGSSDMPGYLSFQTTPDGSITATERMRIDSNGLITGTGTSLGAWTSWTPSWTNLTVGNATVVAKYVQIGKTIHANLEIVWGSTTSASGIWFPSVPVAAATGARAYGAGFAFDSSLTVWKSTVFSRQNGYFVTGDGERISNTAPWTWADGDILTMSLTYEAA